MNEELKHWSDCAVHNEPAMPNGPCNCGGYVEPTQADKVAADRAFDIAFRGDTDGIDCAMAELFARHRTPDPRIEALIAERDGYLAHLRKSDEALRQHACHGGPEVPCNREDWQCREECGQLAGDVLLIIQAALNRAGEA